jgi:lysyl-tRNA synthetase class 2
MKSNASFSSELLVHGTYDDERRVLDLTFRNGRTYTYNDVPASVWQELQEADSPGQYFNSAIRNVFNL